MRTYGAVKLDAALGDGRSTALIDVLVTPGARLILEFVSNGFVGCASIEDLINNCEEF